MNSAFVSCLLKGDNNPPAGQVFFDSSDHIRFEKGRDVSGHNYNCNRRIKIESNISGKEGYTVTIFNLDGIHPLWGNNVQMSPKRMKIVNTHHNMVELRGYGYDENALRLGAPPEAASFAHYGLLLLFNNGEIIQARLNMFDRGICIEYLK